MECCKGRADKAEESMIKLIRGVSIILYATSTVTGLVILLLAYTM